MKSIFKYILALAAFAIVAPTVKADEKGTNGIVVSKTVSEPNNGIYTLTLESYVTGTSVTTTTEERVPADIVLVLDMSGSMSKDLVAGTVGSEDELDKVKGAQEGYYYFKFTGFLIERDYPLHYKDGQWYVQQQVWPNAGKWITLANAGKEYSIAGKTIYESIIRLDALKDAVTEFIDFVKKDAAEHNVTHRIGISTFAEESTNVSELSSDYDALKTIVQGLTAEGVTRSDLGLQTAQTILDASPRDKAVKTVLFFTDGDPTTSSGFETEVADEAISVANALQTSNGATIYSVGILGVANDNQNTFMNAVSSNYPNATSMTNLGEKASASYYMNVSVNLDLSSIFTTIAASATSGSANVTTLTSTTTVIDKVTESFRVPANIQAKDLKVYSSKCNGKAVNGKLTFDDAHKTEFTAAQKTMTVGEDGITTITVTNFDFSANWCGDHGGSTGYSGKKLILEIPIEKAENAVGGVNIETNAPGSGIFNQDTQYDEFPVPKVDFPVTIQIKKRGLLEGETASFKITKKNASGVFEDFATVSVIGNGDELNPPVVKLVDLEPAIYGISETNWSWTYAKDSTPSVTTEGVAVNPFEFVNVKRSDVRTKNAEVLIRNDFKTGTVTKFTGSASASGSGSTQVSNINSGSNEQINNTPAQNLNNGSFNQ